MKNIESFFKDNFEEKAVNPSETVWSKIAQSTDIMRFNKLQRLKRVATYSFGGVLVTVVVATLLWFGWPAQNKDTAPQSQSLTTKNVSQAASEPAPTTPLNEPISSAIDNSKEANNSTTSTLATPTSAKSGNITVATPTNPVSPTTNTTTVAPKSTNSTVPKTAPATANSHHTTPNKTVDKPAAVANNTPLPPTKNATTTPPEEVDQPPMENYELFMPNAFSPNGDGVNDRYELTAAFDINNFSLYIYDRTGQLVFKSTDITYMWTGEMNSKILPAGTYTYLVKYSDEFNRLYQKKGNILLIR
jgi:gliding motility-associated-like protein